MKQNYSHINLLGIIAIYLREIEYYYVLKKDKYLMPLDAYHIDKTRGILSRVLIPTGIYI